MCHLPSGADVHSTNTIPCRSHLVVRYSLHGLILKWCDGLCLSQLRGMPTVCHVCVSSHCIYHLSDCSAGFISSLNFCKWKAEKYLSASSLMWQTVSVPRHGLVKMHKGMRWASGWGLNVITLNHFYFISQESPLCLFPSFFNSNCFLSIKLIKRGRFGFHGFIWHAKLIPETCITRNCCRGQWQRVNFKTWIVHKIFFFF